MTVLMTENDYPIYIGKDLIKPEAAWLASLASKKIFIITQESIAKHHLMQFMQALDGLENHVYYLPTGEQYKTITEWQAILNCLLEKNYSRDSVLIALGGGMVGDMTGFAAACYQRGVDYIQIPTTLMAQVDSAIGGKCGVNHVLGKNMIGVFHQPQSVVVDINLLASLPEREYISGIAEIIKYGLICDKEFFAWLENNYQQIMMRDDEALLYTVHRCISIKTRFVKQDERDHGIRQLLNFGHSFAHALENALEYQTILHGEAVAMGMVMAAYLSSERRLLLKEDLARIINLLQKTNLLQKSRFYNLADLNLFPVMLRDKKNKSNNLNLILLREIGIALKVEEVSHQEIEKAHLFLVEEVM